MVKMIKDFFCSNCGLSLSFEEEDRFYKIERCYYCLHNFHKEYDVLKKEMHDKLGYETIRRVNLDECNQYLNQKYKTDMEIKLKEINLLKAKLAEYEKEAENEC